MSFSHRKCAALTFGSMNVVSYLQMRKTKLPTGQPLFQIWLSSGIFWLARATGLIESILADMTFTMFLSCLIPSNTQHDVTLCNSLVISSGRYILFGGVSYLCTT